MSKNLQTTYCYVRATRPGKTGKHSIACVALAATDSPDKVRVAFSVCSHKDNFSKALGRVKAVSRLNSDKHSVITNRSVGDIMNVSDLESVLMRARFDDEKFIVDSPIQGALNDLATAQTSV